MTRTPVITAAHWALFPKKSSKFNPCGILYTLRLMNSLENLRITSLVSLYRRLVLNEDRPFFNFLVFPNGVAYHYCFDGRGELLIVVFSCFARCKIGRYLVTSYQVHPKDTTVRHSFDVLQMYL